MGDVVKLPCETTLDIPVDRVLDGAKDAELEGVLVIGVDQDGELYFACSKADKHWAHWMASTFSHYLLSGQIGERAN